jgi:hypothetical protein
MSDDGRRIERDDRSESNDDKDLREKEAACQKIVFIQWEGQTAPKAPPPTFENTAIRQRIFSECFQNYERSRSILPLVPLMT